METNNVMTGKVTRVVIAKGYGFIAGDDKKDYFFHMSSVDPASIAFRHLTEGVPVSFTIHPAIADKKNLQAKEVTVVNPSLSSLSVASSQVQ